MVRYSAIIILILFCGCDTIHEGTITNLTYKPAHTETTITPILDMDGNITLQTSTNYIPDRWYMTFERLNDEETETISRTVRISKEMYYSLNVGDWYEE